MLGRSCVAVLLVLWAGFAAAKPASVVIPERAFACPCGYGLVCVGPRGGRYCLRPDGSKKYGQ